MYGLLRVEMIRSECEIVRVRDGLSVGWSECEIVCV